MRPCAGDARAPPFSERPEVCAELALPAKEFTEEHISGAVNIPLKELDRRAPRELDRERPVIVYCNDYQ